VYLRNCSPEFPVLTLDSGPYLEGWYSDVVFESCAHLARCGSSQYCWCRFRSSWHQEVHFIIFPSVPCDLFARCLLVFTVYAACNAYFIGSNAIILMIWDEEWNLLYYFFHCCTVHVASIISLIFQLMHTLKSTKIHIKPQKTCPYMFRSHF
jgi:hypothetical protein